MYICLYIYCVYIYIRYPYSMLAMGNQLEPMDLSPYQICDGPFRSHGGDGDVRCTWRWEITRFNGNHGKTKWALQPTIFAHVCSFLLTLGASILRATHG